MQVDVNNVKRAPRRGAWIVLSLLLAFILAAAMLPQPAAAQSGNPRRLPEACNEAGTTGGTLRGVARNLGIPWRQLARLGGMRAPFRLAAGDLVCKTDRGAWVIEPANSNDTNTNNSNTTMPVTTTATTTGSNTTSGTTLPNTGSTATTTGTITSTNTTNNTTATGSSYASNGRLFINNTNLRDGHTYRVKLRTGRNGPGRWDILGQINLNRQNGGGTSISLPAGFSNANFANEVCYKDMTTNDLICERFAVR